ncbi:MAG: hypothetical protein KAI97_00330, partial [Gemmatimonadetes bacterium]|nr:hypothetical protein [Gemmatimonadota bacterium]
MTKRLPALTVLLTLAMLSQSDAQEPTGYNVTIAAATPRVAVIEIVLPVAVAELHMSERGAGQFEDGWAHFVREVSAVDANGNNMTVEKADSRSWRMGSGQPPIRVRYVVDLAHDLEEEWPGGIDGAAYATGWGVFYTGRALFMLPDGQPNDLRVTFDLPDGWHASTPWDVLEGEQNSFRAGDEVSLTESILFAGHHENLVIEKGGFEVLFAFGGSSVIARKDEFGAAADQTFTYYVDLLGDAPRPPPDETVSRILVVMNEAGVTDGEVIGQHISMLLEPEPDPTAQIFAQFMFPHEFFHLWNGTSIRRDGPEDWFSEGFTNFYTMKVLYRSGALDEAAYFGFLNGLLYQRYSADEGTGVISMRDAVPEKDAHWGLIYGGGTFVAICHDIEIRRQTDNAASLDDLMRTMFDRYGGSTETYTAADVEALVSELSGVDQTDFYARHIYGVEPIPID